MIDLTEEERRVALSVWAGLVSFVALLYLITGIFGIPRLHRQLRNRVVGTHAEFIRWEAAIGHESTALPTPYFHAISFPVLPGVVFCSSDFAIARLYGETHWSLYWIAAPTPIRIADTLTGIS